MLACLPALWHADLTSPAFTAPSQEPELSLKRIAASSLSDIAKHTPELAQAVVDAGAVAYLAPLVINQDAKLKRQVRPSAPASAGKRLTVDCVAHLWVQQLSIF